MSSDLMTTAGLDNGRDWESLPADEGPIEWTVDHRQGLIQGPLDLEFLRGRKISLALEPGQMALLVQEGDLKAVYLDGAHYLDIGHGTHQVPADGKLIFLAADRHINLNWSRKTPLRMGEGRDEALIGGCSLTIDGPARFFRTFLDTPEMPEPEFLVRLIDQMVRGVMEDILGTMFDHTFGHAETAGSAEIQSRLTGLTPEDLADDLAPCGLACVNLAIYTAAPPVENEFVTVGPQETAGHLNGVGHN
ncbi:MAG: hypothetical protein ABFS42_15100 [Candidatus Krumholzibacteriota bacterium]